MNYIKRIDCVRKLSETDRLDAVLVWNLVNVRYLSGFTGSEGALLVTGDRKLFLTDSRYETQIKDQAPDFEPRINRDKIRNIAQTVAELGLKRVGFEDETLSVGRHKELCNAAADAGSRAEFIPMGMRLAGLRLHKDAEEIAVLREAALIAEKAFEHIIPMMRPGVRETEIALELDFAMRRNGAAGTSFDTIIASGPRGALPHGVASDKKISEGELVVIDWGCVYKGYCSDQTMTVAIGDVGDEERKVYGIVRQAQALALAALKPGVPLKDVDRIARDHVREAGYGSYFEHGLGHGVGLDIHEDPRLTVISEWSAESGHVVTVEPGIYLPGHFGVRVEDTVVVTDGGYERITTLDKHMRQLG